MSPKSNQPNLLTAALVLLCVALAAVLVLLLLQIAELDLDLPAMQARQSDIVVTPTPLATVPGNGDAHVGADCDRAAIRNAPPHCDSHTHPDADTPPHADPITYGNANAASSEPPDSRAGGHHG